MEWIADNDGAECSGLASIATLYQSSTATVFLRGEVDISNASMLRERLRTCLTQGATNIIVDMTDLSFIDCAGISALEDAIHQLDGGGSLTVRNPPRTARIILRITAMLAEVAILDDPGLSEKGAASDG